jgi:hypothetical protein
VAKHSPEARTLWLIAGVAAGLCLSFVWPHEPTAAATALGSDKFQMVTVPVVQLGVPGGTHEAVFVLDKLTGKLTGAIISDQSGKFSHAYFRNLAADFKLAREGDYVVVTGAAGLPSQGRTPMANGIIYVGEMTTGKVAAYGFPYAASNRPVPPIALTMLDFFAFRESQ